MSQENQLLLKESSGLKEAYQLIIKTSENENNIAEYFIQILEKFSKKEIHSILEIHPINEDSYQVAFRKAGFEVTPLPLDMRISAVGGEQDGDRFIIGKNFNFPVFKRKFDAVVITHGCFGRFISLDKTGEFLERLHNSLENKALFLFEFWHLPGIDRPASDEKGHKDWERISSATDGEIMRFTNSKLHLDTSILSVDMHYLIEKDNHLQRYNESHMWRLYTLSEIDLLLHSKNFQLTKVFKFSTLEEPEFSSFRLLCICEKN